MIKINVIQVTWNWIKESGGGAQSVLDFAELLNSPVISFTKESSGQNICSETVNQLHIPYMDIELNRYAYSCSPVKQQAEKVLSNANLIIIHGFYRYHFDWAVSIAKKNNIPYWIIPHGSLDPYVFTYRSLPKKLWYSLKGEKSFSDADAIIFATKSEKDKSLMMSQTEKSKVIHWPVDRVETKNSVEAKFRIRKENNIPHDAKVLIFIGRFHPMKRPVETIKAVAACNANNVYLMMMGPDSDVLTAADCNNFCVKNNYENIRFIEPVFGKEKYDYYMAADAFISLSHRENFGYTVAEALSSGIPVILSPGNDLSKDIKHLSCGWLLAEDNPKSACSAVNEFAVTPVEQLVEMGLRGQQWARAELSPEWFKSQIQALALETVEKTKLKH